MSFGHSGEADGLLGAVRSDNIEELRRAVEMIDAGELNLAGTVRACLGARRAVVFLLFIFSFF